MAIRTTEEAVRALVESDEDINMTQFIEVASSLVDEVCTDDDDVDLYGSARMELIERWLAAHFYAIRDPRVGQETAGPVSASYQYRLGLNLAVTTYGQQVLVLDTEGGLAALNAQATDGSPRKGSIRWLGKARTTTDS